MARKLRLQYPGAIYHVMSRGDRGKAVFRSRKDREAFLQTLGQACEKTEWQVHAWCLMEDHFQVVVETPRTNLSPGMAWLMSAYTIRFNRSHQLGGRLFSGRYKSLPVEGDGYLKSVCDYVHLFPDRARVLPARRKLSEFLWSSYMEYLKAPWARQPWLRVDPLLAEHGIAKDNAAGRKRFERLMELRRAADDGEEFRQMQRGWYVGSKAFREDLLALMNCGPEAAEAEIRESGERKARRLVQTELRALGWSSRDLDRRPKGDPEKVRIALRLRRETTMTLEWIAQALHMGVREYVAHLLHWHGRQKKAAARAV